jgi:hypothetical protein
MECHLPDENSCDIASFIVHLIFDNLSQHEEGVLLKGSDLSMNSQCLSHFIFMMNFATIDDSRDASILWRELLSDLRQMSQQRGLIFMHSISGLRKLPNEKATHKDR